MSLIMEALPAEPGQSLIRDNAMGELLAPQEVAKARKLETDNVRQMLLDQKVPIREAYDGDVGCQVLLAGWI